MIRILSRPVPTRRLVQAGLTKWIPYSTTTPPPDLDEGEKRIYDKLTEKFTPSHLQVQDVSGGCGSFYAISITSKAFTELSTLKQHRLVTDTLKEDIKEIHGLQLKTIPETN